MPDNDHERKPIHPDAEEFADPGSQSLADALKISFRALAIVMLLLIFYFVVSGVFSVEPGKVALILRFGKIRGKGPERVRKPGLQFALPYPIDEKIILPGPQKTQEIAVNSFWYKLSEEDRQKLIQGGSPEIADVLGHQLVGYNITGDQNLIHTKWNVQFTVVDPEKYFRCFGREGVPAEKTDEVPQLVRQTITQLIENRVIRHSVTLKVYDALRDKTTEFAKSVRIGLQAELDEIGSGVNLIGVNLIEQVPPRQVRAAFDAVAQANQDQEQKTKEAQAEANHMLTSAAGAVGPELAQVWTRLEESQAELKEAPKALKDAPKKLDEADAELKKAKAELKKAQADPKTDPKRVAEIRERITPIENRIKEHPARVVRLKERLKGLPALIVGLEQKKNELYAKAENDVKTIEGNAITYKIAFFRAAAADAGLMRRILAGLSEPGAKEPTAKMLELWIEQKRIEVLQKALAKADLIYVIAQNPETKIKDLILQVSPAPEHLKSMDKLRLDQTR